VVLPPNPLSETSGPLEKKSLKEEVFQLLRRRVVGGDYALGEWLRQEEIANELDVSPTPVREALDQLVAEGLAERIPYRGVRVPQLTEEEIADAYVLRLLLESVAVRLAAHHISDEQADALQAMLLSTQRLLESDDVSSYQQLNRQLHRGIVSASGNRLLVRLYELVINQFPDWMMYGGMMDQPDLFRSALRRDFEEHHILIELIRHHEIQAASRQVVKHMHAVGEELVAFTGVSADLLSDKEREIRALLPDQDEPGLN
jgi:DNA-binding GntR family transcriptional regulator